jgi:hypothetical protein
MRNLMRCARSARSSHFSAKAKSRPLSVDVPARCARSTLSAAFRLYSSSLVIALTCQMTIPLGTATQHQGDWFRHSRSCVRLWVTGYGSPLSSLDKTRAAKILAGFRYARRSGTRVPQRRFFLTMADIKEIHYRERAEECLRLAAQTKHEGLRKQYAHLADCYLELAEAEAAVRSGNNSAKRSTGPDQLGT